MFFRLALAILFSVVASSNTWAQDEVRDSVVKIHVTQRPPDFLRPWTKGRSRQTSGTGVIIDGQRILTNAHVVLYASRVHVQANQDSKRELATVLAVAPEVDLAVITVNDKSFFEGRTPLSLSEDLPKLKDPVNVYGFPIGGEQLSITEGIISRIECVGLSFGGFGLRIQIDAALNRGNSGGPAILYGKIVGLVFSGIPSAENIGYLIGAEEVATFLADIEDGQYDGKPRIHDHLQTVENEALRSRLGLTDEQGGLLVNERYREGADYPLRPFDVITRIGPYDLDRKGYVQVSDDLKLSFLYVVPKLAIDGKVEATLVRDGELTSAVLFVSSQRDSLIPLLKGDYPSYFIHGPILFTTPSQEFTTAIGGATNLLARLGSPLIARRSEKPSFAGEQLVILGSKLFPHATSEGYNNTAFAVVTHINDQPVENLSHAAQLTRQASDEFLVMKLEGAPTKTLVFRTDELIDASEEILENEGIRLHYSEDLKAAVLGQ